METSAAIVFGIFGVAVCLHFIFWAWFGRGIYDLIPSLFPFITFSPFVCAMYRSYWYEEKAVKYLQANLYLLFLQVHQRVFCLVVPLQLLLVGTLLLNHSSCFITH